MKNLVCHIIVLAVFLLCLTLKIDVSAQREMTEQEAKQVHSQDHTVVLY